MPLNALLYQRKGIFKKYLNRTLLKARLRAYTAMLKVLEIKRLRRLGLSGQVTLLKLRFVILHVYFDGLVVVRFAMSRARLVNHQNFLNLAVYRSALLVVYMQDEVDKFVILLGEHIVGCECLSNLRRIVVTLQVDIFCPLIGFA